MLYETAPAQVGKNDIAKARRKQRLIIVRTEPDQFSYFRVRGGCTFELACVQRNLYGLRILSGGGAFIIAEVMKVGDFHLAQLFAALASEAFLRSLAWFQFAAR